MTHRSLPKVLSLALALAVASIAPIFAGGSALAATPGDEASAPAESDSPKAPEGAPEGAKSRASTKSKKSAKPAKSKAKRKTRKSAVKHHAKRTKSKVKVGKHPTAKAPKTKRATRKSKGSAKRSKPTPKADDTPKKSRKGSRGSCTEEVVTLDRGGVESEHVALLDCHDKPLKNAVAKISVLARPLGASKRDKASPRVTTGVIARLGAIAKKFPGRTITLMGGPPSSRGGSGSSAHHAGRAVDLRVEGIDNQKVAEFCRTLPDTGCGYYPNAAFVHVDERVRGTGKAFWIDVSEPGEPPQYVRSWPPEAPAKTEATQKSAKSKESDAPKPAPTQSKAEPRTGDEKKSRRAKSPAVPPETPRDET